MRHNEFTVSADKNYERSTSSERFRNPKISLDDELLN
jgi:hypothetical protein